MQHTPFSTARNRALVVVATAALVSAGSAVLAGDAEAAPTTIEVSPQGLDVATCGLSALPCKTIQYGIDRAADGDTVHVAAGTYTEAVHVVGKQIALVGAPGAVIDGAGATQTGSGASGVVFIGAGTGPVSVSGFTVQNPIDHAVITVHGTDTGASVTLSGNTLLGAGSAGATGSDAAGIEARDNRAPVTVQGNDISGVFLGVDLRNSGPATVTGNTVHDLLPLALGPGAQVPGRGVVVTSDDGASVTDQVIRDNTLRDYSGLGVGLSAGDDSTNCTDDPCTGSISAEVTGNTLDLDAPAAGDLPGAAALSLRSVADGSVAVALGGNTGTVAAPTRPIDLDTAGGGTVAVTPAGATNRIVPMPTPTLTTVAPSSVTTSEAAQPLTVTATDPVGGDAIAHARYSVALTSKAALTPAQVTLEQKVGTTYVAVPLSGSTADGGSLTGSFPLPTSDSGLPADGTARTSDLRIAVTDPTVPAGTLTLATALVEIPTGADGPALNAVATDTDTIKVVATTTLGTPTYSPAAPTSAVVPTMTIPVSAPGAKVDGGYIAVRNGDNLRTATVAKGKATVSLLKFTGGRHLLRVDYLGSDMAAYATRTYTLTVAKAASRLKVALSPTRITSRTTGAKAIVTVSAGGATVDGGTVTISSAATPKIGSAKVVHGRATIALPRFGAGTHRWRFTYSGNAYALGTKTAYVFKSY